MVYIVPGTLYLVLSNRLEGVYYLVCIWLCMHTDALLTRFVAVIVCPHQHTSINIQHIIIRWFGFYID